MKKPFLILILIIWVITGCKQDESGLPKPSDTSGSIIGTWFVKTQITTGTVLGLPVDDTQTGFTTQDYYIFTDDNAVKVSSVDEGVSTGNYTYNTSSKKLTLSNVDNAATYTVSKITADELEMSTTVSIPAFGTSTNVTLKLTH